MVSRILPLLLVLFSASARAYVFPIEIVEYIDNTRVVASINEDDIDSTRAWTPFEAGLPLGIEGALKAVREQCDADPALENATLSGIELKRLPHHADHWHYLVKMKALHDDKMQSHYFIVLMNGKVVPGIKEPESFK